MYDCVLVEMFCQNCGTKLFDTGKFCHNYGVKQGMYSLYKSYIFIYSCCGKILPHYIFVYAGMSSKNFLVLIFNIKLLYQPMAVSQ